jgi:diguanylate cyclase (GGDEF)-like protein
MKTAKLRTLTPPSVDTAPRPPAHLERLAGLAALLAIGLGAAGLVGWLFDVEWLRRPASDLRELRPSMALGLILLGTALWLARAPRHGDERRAWSRALAFLVVAGGVLVLVEHLLDIRPLIDGVLDDADPDRVGASSPVAALAVISTGLWLAVADCRRRTGQMLEDAMAALSGAAVIATAVGYLYGAADVFGLDRETGVSPQTMAALVALWLGILVSCPDGRWMRLLRSTGSGGHAIRSLIPVLVLVPIACGGFVVIGVENGWFETNFGAALVVGIAIVVFVGISLSTASQLEALDEERHRLEERLKGLVERDPLTGVYNRRRLDDELERQLALAQRREGALTVMAIDLDGFKPLNDTWGHATGDELLVATAQTLTEELRSTDFICRPGGDEFIVLLPDTAGHAARLVAGKLIRSLREIRRPRPGGEVIELRASVGIATSEEERWASPAELLAAADRALYAAKQAGGDRFAVDERPLVFDGD